MAVVPNLPLNLLYDMLRPALHRRSGVSDLGEAGLARHTRPSSEGRISWDLISRKRPKSGPNSWELCHNMPQLCLNIGIHGNLFGA